MRTMANKEIHIKVNGRVADNDCRKTLSKGAPDKVKWTANDNGGRWKVVFVNGTPFFENAGTPVTVFRVPQAGSSTPSLRPSGPSQTPYKYEIWEDQPGGIRTDDPDILIED